MTLVVSSLNLNDILRQAIVVALNETGSIKAAAGALGITIRTIHTHKKNFGIYRLGTRGQWYIKQKTA